MRIAASKPSPITSVIASGAERAGLVAEITGRPLAFRVITEEQLRAGLTQAGLPAGAVNTVVSIQASFAAGAFDIVTATSSALAAGRPSLSATCLLGP